MERAQEGSLLWEPDSTWINQANISDYITWLKENKQLDFDDYHSLWKWSVENIASFWASLWEYFDIKAATNYETVLSSREMPGGKWFKEATLNYTEHIFRKRDWEQTAIIHASETRQIHNVSWKQLYEDTAKFQQKLIHLGVRRGDRIVAYASNIYETIVAFLATASIGAIWSSASPDFGTQSVIDRFKQIEPKVMITVDGYQYNGKNFDRMKIINAIQKELPTLESTILIPFLNENSNPKELKNGVSWKDVMEEKQTEMTYEYIPFNDPLWVLFSSGTTGKPKPIVHSQGGILLEHLKALTFHADVGEDDRFFWYTTTGWMMWNFLVGALLTGSTVILYDGSPGYPNKKMLWQFAEDTKMTVLGTSASFLIDCMKNDFIPREEFDLSHLKCISSTGSPLPPEGFQWCYEHVKRDLWIASVSGGTDVCTAFILGMPTLPVYAGELQCRGLGAKIESFTETGEAKINEVGELVLTEPLPSMPIFFWNDEDGSRLHESYFDVFPGVWRHGDYLKITDQNTCVIYGRSDATINRGGIRIGTSEIYRAIDSMPEVADSLIVDVPLSENNSFVPLFIRMNEGVVISDKVKQKIKEHIKSECSPRHVPTSIHQVKDLPKTLNGKKLEIPVKKILMGESVEDVVNKGSLANPDSLTYFINFNHENS